MILKDDLDMPPLKMCGFMRYTCIVYGISLQYPKYFMRFDFDKMCWNVKQIYMYRLTDRMTDKLAEMVHNYTATGTAWCMGHYIIAIALRDKSGAFVKHYLCPFPHSL